MYKIDTKITSKQWDEFVSKLQYKTPLMSPVWAEFEKKRGDFKIYVVRKGDDINAILPMQFVNAKRGKFIYLRHAPILDWSKVDKYKKLLKTIVDFLKEQAKKHGMWSVRIHPYFPEESTVIKLLKDLGFKKATNHEVDAERSAQIDLTQPLEVLFRKMRLSTKQRIRQAEKLGIKVIEKNDWSTFAKIFKATVNRRKGWKALSLKYLEKQYEFLAKAGMSKMYFAIYEGKPLAAGIFTTYQDIVIYHHSGSMPAKLPTMYAIIWHVIQEYKAKGYKIFDLWGTSPRDNPKHPWYNLSIFKWGFGTYEVKMLHSYDLIVNPLWHLTRIFERIEGRKWR